MAYFKNHGDMNGPKERFENILNSEQSRVRKTYSGHDVVFPLIEIIRCIDFQTCHIDFVVENRPASETTSNHYHFGWSLAFYLFYRDLVYDDNIPMFEFDLEERERINSVIQDCASIQLSRQCLDFVKAGLFSLEENGEKEFIFRSLIKGAGDELYERISLQHYFEEVEKVHGLELITIRDKLPEMRMKLSDIVNVSHGRYLQYTATKEIEVFYRDLAHLYLITNYISDDFGENDMFGGYPYKDYLSLIEECIMSALMHRDCCVALMTKKKGIDFRDVFTYCFSAQRHFGAIANVYEWPIKKVQQIASCLAVTKDNYEYHLTYPGLRPAPYYQISNDIWMRSAEGSIGMPVFFLNRELKRRFPNDYFEAVNRREGRFRRELYRLFPQDRIACINREIKIGTTDIDAVIFDTQTKTLGLFQLKWQDAFSSSMKERKSRISNAIPKSVEWIDKVEAWIKSNKAKSFLKKCGINDEVTEVYLFVLSRNHIHFTNEELDSRATWGSWFQLLESLSDRNTGFEGDDNPIEEMAHRLRALYPALRNEREGEIKVADTELNFGGYCVRIQGR